MTVKEWKRKNPPIRRKSKTNTDQIKAMPDEELDGFISRIKLPNGKTYGLKCEIVEARPITCKKCGASFQLKYGEGQCEHCGTSENVKTEYTHSWVMTLCDKCREEEIKKFNERYK